MIKDLIALSLTIGLLLLLVFIVAGDFYIALQTNRPIDEDIVNLIQMSITGIVGIISGYVVAVAEAGASAEAVDSVSNAGKSAGNSAKKAAKSKILVKPEHSYSIMEK